MTHQENLKEKCQHVCTPTCFSFLDKFEVSQKPCYTAPHSGKRHERHVGVAFWLAAERILESGHTSREKLRLARIPKKAMRTENLEAKPSSSSWLVATSRGKDVVEVCKVSHF